LIPLNAMKARSRNFRYVSILSEPSHQMEMNSKLYALAPVPPKKQAAIHIE
jgi:hypothetical protein